MTGTNAPVRPVFEGQIVRFQSPHADVMLFDIARLNKYGQLTWHALNNPTTEEIDLAEDIQT